MPKLGLERHIVDQGVYDGSVRRFRDAGIVLPTFAELADPDRQPAALRAAVSGVEPDAAHPLNLFRVHWFNDATRRGQARMPEHVVLPKALTGVAAPIVVAIGDRFPMIGTHKVLAAYGCLAPRIVTGQFDPTAHRALWPSTGNYCRGGVAISRIMGCRGIAILPEGMSRERFAWLENWVSDQADIVRTTGSESNVKEIYDKCAELEDDPRNIVFNQFCEFGNYLAHLVCTGPALARIVDVYASGERPLRLGAFVSATGSAGTLAAGDYLKERYGARIAAVEALECPTLLYNGFGEHNIQGIGDKHVPLIHNVMNTDVAVAVSDRSTDALGVLFGTETGHAYLAGRRGVPPDVLAHLRSFGLSSICNVVAAIKIARYHQFGPDEAIVTVATDGAEMYGSERERAIRKYFPRGFDEVTAGEVFGEHILGAGTDHLLELSLVDRHRVFNLGYYTWVEQQGIPVADFNARRKPSFWKDLGTIVPEWDTLIREFNARTGAAAAAS